MDYRKTFARRLREAISRDGRSFRALAIRTGMRHNQIYTYANGIYAPSIDRAAQLADALGVSLDWLMGRDSQKKSAATLDSAQT